MVAELAVTAMRLQEGFCDNRDSALMRYSQNGCMDVEWIKQALAQKPNKTRTGLANALGVNPSAVTRMLAGNRQLKAREIPKVREYFEAADESGVKTKPKIDEDARLLDHAPLITPTDWPRDLPVFGVPIAGHQGVFELNGRALDYLRRPPRLLGVGDAYAVYVRGSSMSPWREDGQVVCVHPHVPARIGDYVVVQFKPESSGEAPRAIIKQLVKRTEKELHLRQLNPSKEITISAAKVSAVHRVMEWTELLGV